MGNKLLKLLKAALPFLLVAGILYGGAKFIDSKLDRLSARLEAKLAETDKKATTIIAEKTAANEAKDKENAILAAKNAVLETEKTKLREERDKARKDAEKAWAELKTAPPEEILVKTQTWLDTKEIWLRLNTANQVEALFSLAAFRTNAIALDKGRYFEFTLVPNLQADLSKTTIQLANSEEAGRNKDVQIVGHIKIEKAKDDQIATRDQVIKSQKKANLFKDILKFLAGIAAGLFFGK